MIGIHTTRELIALVRRYTCRVELPFLAFGNLRGVAYIPYAIYFGALGVSTKASFNRAGEEFAAWRSGFLRYMHETYSSEWLKVFDCWFMSVKGFEWGDVVGQCHMQKSILNVYCCCCCFCPKEFRVHIHHHRSHHGNDCPVESFCHSIRVVGVRWCVFDCYAGRFVVSFKFIGDIFAAIVVSKSEYLGVAVLSFGTA